MLLRDAHHPSRPALLIAVHSAKLAGALNGLWHGIAPDPAMTVASLKRILEIHNRVVAALDGLRASPLITPERHTHLRAETFGIREDMLALIARLRG